MFYNLFFNLEFLEMSDIDKDLGQTTSQFLKPYQHHQSTVEKSQSFHSNTIFTDLWCIYNYFLYMIFFYVFCSPLFWLPFFILKLSESFFWGRRVRHPWSPQNPKVPRWENLPTKQTHWIDVPGCVDRWKWHDWFLCWILSQSSRTFHLSGSPCFWKNKPNRLQIFWTWGSICF